MSESSAPGAGSGVAVLALLTMMVEPGLSWSS